MIVVKPYTYRYKNLWNNFVNQSHQPTFLLKREFMDYHSDRFQDFSLLIFYNNILVALFPAHKKETAVYSHQGLTYGGLLFQNTWEKNLVSQVIDALLFFLKSEAITQLYIKAFPTFYNKGFSSVINTLLLQNNAEIYRLDKVLAIDYSLPFSIHKTKLKHFRKNKNKGFVIEKTTSFSSFWTSVLEPRLQDKHKVKPVHSLEEIELLHSRFPEQIIQYNIYLDEVLLAGITIFDKGHVVKSQYGATTVLGEKHRALEYLFLFLIYKYKEEGKQFFSMGTVTENNELGYNKGLLKQKQELGCVVYSQTFFSFNIT